MHTLAASPAPSGASVALTGIGLILLILVSVCAYFLPVIAGRVRRVPNLGQIAVVNVLLGWTMIGWIVALVMALKPVPAAYPPPYRAR